MFSSVSRKPQKAEECLPDKPRRPPARDRSVQGKDAVAMTDGGDRRGIEMVDVSDMERIAEMGSVHLRLLSVDIVGECDVPSLALEGVTHKADASEELGYGALREEGSENYRLIRSKAPQTLVGIAIDIGLPKSRDLPTAFEQRCGIRHIASHISADFAQPVIARFALRELPFKGGVLPCLPLPAMPEIAIDK